MCMRTKYIPAITMLTAGLIVGIVSIVQHADVIASLKLLLVVLVAFYILGMLAYKIIDKVLRDFNEKESDEQPDLENEDEQSPGEEESEE